MPSNRPHLNVRLNDEWAERLPGLIQRAREALGIPTLSQSDLVLMGLSQVEKWLDRLAVLEKERDAPEVPADAGEKRGRPRKTPPAAEEGGAS